MTPDELQARTKAFALRAIRLVAALPRSPAARTIGSQFLDAATSVGANYRAARRARSRKEFVSKISIVVEEADETAYWIELMVDGNLMPQPLVQPLLDEANALTRIFAATRLTTLRTMRRSQSQSIAKSPDHQIAKSSRQTIKEG